MSDAPEQKEAAPAECERPRFQFHRLSDEELRAFVDDFVSGRLFTLHHMSPEDAKRDLGLVFMPLGLAGLGGCGLSDEDVQNIGTIYERLEVAGPRSINGWPCFFSMRIMHKGDWARAAAAIARERERRKEIEL